MIVPLAQHQPPPSEEDASVEEGGKALTTGLIQVVFPQIFCHVMAFSQHLITPDFTTRNVSI